MRIPLAREGYPFILATIFVTIIFTITGLRVITYLSLALTTFVIAFFRDPEREIPSGDSIISPADGKVIKVERCGEGRILKTEAQKVSIFMSLFDVHVNRIPYDGKVLDTFYNPGRFFSADLDKASLENEQNAILIESANGKKIVVNQIAGLVARRIVCNLKEGDIVKKGERFGMIILGSRLDVYLPIDCKLEVKVGDRVKAGSSVLGYWDRGDKQLAISS